MVYCIENTQSYRKVTEIRHVLTKLDPKVNKSTNLRQRKIVRHPNKEQHHLATQLECRIHTHQIHSQRMAPLHHDQK